MNKLPIVDLSTDDVKTMLGVTGAVTIEALCDSENIIPEGLNPIYCPGATPVARLANLRSTPHDIGKLRGYGYDAQVLALGGTGTIGTMSKLNDDQYWNSFTYCPGLDKRCVVRDMNGNLWVGAECASSLASRGLYKWDGASWTRYTTPTIAGTYVYALAKDGSGNIWIGTEGGFSIYNPITGTFTKYANGLLNVPIGKLGSNRITSLLYNPITGYMWVGTSNGLTHIRNLSYAWDILKTTNGLPSNYIQCLAYGGDGDVWMGTAGQGMARITYNAGIYTIGVWNTSTSAIPSNTVRAIIIDTLAYAPSYVVWLATNAGLGYYDASTDGWATFFNG